MADDIGRSQAQRRGAPGKRKHSANRLPVPGVLERVFPGVVSLDVLLRSLFGKAGDAPDLDQPPGSEGFRAVRLSQSPVLNLLHQVA